MFQTVVCVVAHSAVVQQLAGDGNTVNNTTSLGYFETKRDAEQMLADAGFTRNSWDGWIKYSHYQRAHVQRMIIERT